MAGAGNTLRLNEWSLAESTEPSLAVKLEYDIYSASLHSIPMSFPIRKDIFLLLISESWEHWPRFCCKPFPKTPMYLSYPCVTFFFFNKLQQDLGNLSITQTFPWYIAIIFILSYWVCLLSKSCSIFAKFLLTSATSIHSVLSTSSLININKNSYMFYSTWNNQNLACQLKSSWWQVPVVFSPFSVILQNVWVSSLSGSTEGAEPFHSDYFNQFTFEVLSLLSL